MPVACDVRELQLASADGAPLPPYAPGAHVDLHLGPGLTRQYSLCGPAQERGYYRIAVKLEQNSRGGSRAVHEGLRPGAQLEISAPHNNFKFHACAPHSILIAGGIGITPLLCMAQELLRTEQTFELHYFARSQEHAAFAQQLTSGAWHDFVHLHFGLQPSRTAEALQRVLGNRIGGAQLYLCGPSGFMDLVRQIAGDRGWPADSVNLEYFKAGEPLASPGTDRPIEVTLARRGQTITVPAAVPIIDALRAAGVEVQTSCEQGVCGTCLTGVLDGVPDHRDLFLTDQEKASGTCMAVCVSRARTDHLALDL
jgi:vanillate monooxygenase ferredoxin subunit